MSLTQQQRLQGILTCVIFFAGCGARSEKLPDLVPVSGIVTFNGKPLPKATIAFHPKEQGRSSYGRTGENGEYSLKYTDDTPGAVAGAHRVEITTKEEVVSPEGQLISESQEILPARFHAATILTADVSNDHKTINFELKSK